MLQPSARVAFLIELGKFAEAAAAVAAVPTSFQMLANVFADVGKQSNLVLGAECQTLDGR